MEAVKTEAVLQAEVVHLSRLAKRVIKEMKRKIFGEGCFTGLNEFTSEEVGE